MEKYKHKRRRVWAYEPNPGHSCCHATVVIMLRSEMFSLLLLMAFMTALTFNCSGVVYHGCCVSCVRQQ